MDLEFVTLMMRLVAWTWNIRCFEWTSTFIIRFVEWTLKIRLFERTLMIHWFTLTLIIRVFERMLSCQSVNGLRAFDVLMDFVYQIP